MVNSTLNSAPPSHSNSAAADLPEEFEKTVLSPHSSAIHRSSHLVLPSVFISEHANSRTNQQRWTYRATCLPASCPCCASRTSVPVDADLPSGADDTSPPNKCHGVRSISRRKRCRRSAPTSASRLKAHLSLALRRSILP